MFSIFIVYHKVLYEKFYETISEENKKHLVFYGVNEKLTNIPLKSSSVYEPELPIYNPQLQEKRYNEASAIYHIYANRLYIPTQYVGFLQYDMCIENVSLNQVKDVIQDNPNKSIIFSSFYALDESKHNLYGSLRLLTEPITGFGSLLNNYNTFFSKNYSIDTIIKSPWIMCNTFIIPIQMYEKYMSWVSSYLFGEIDMDDMNINKENRRNHINRGHIIEICTALFLAIEFLEGSDICHININHIHECRV